MKNKLVVMLSIIVLLFSFSVTQTEAATKQTVKWPFYAVTKNGRTMYVMGSIHVGKKSMYPFPAEITTALKKSTHYVTEIELAKLADPAVYKEMLLPNNALITDSLDADGKAALAKIYTKYDIAPQMQEALAKMHAYAFYLTLNQLIDMTKSETGVLPYDSSYGVDVQLYQLAKQWKKPNKGLETVAVQFNALQMMSPDNEFNTQIKALADGIDNPKQTALTSGEITSIDQLLEMYINGTFVYPPLSPTATEAEKLAYDRTQQYLLRERNVKWVPQLEKMLADKKNSYFVTVGLLHLWGEDGILTLLQQKGYKVTKVKFAVKKAA